MSAPRRELRIETATPGDISALSDLRVEQGWHPNARLLRAIEAWDGGRIFVLRASALAGTSGAQVSSADDIIATVVAIVAGPVGVIGNVIVAAPYRRRGLARILMEAALRWQHSRGAAHVLLAATPEGRPLYRNMGFVNTELSYFATGPLINLDFVALRAKAEGIGARLMPTSALADLATLDAQAYGGDRMGLLGALLREGETWLYVATGKEKDADAKAHGYLILRQPQAIPEIVQIGPWVARSPEAANALVAAALSVDAPWRASLRLSGDTPDDINVFAIGPRRQTLEVLVSAGATLSEDDIVMQLDFVSGSPPRSIVATGGPPQPVAAHPEWLYAWLAPMVF